MVTAAGQFRTFTGFPGTEQILPLHEMASHIKIGNFYLSVSQCAKTRSMSDTVSITLEFTPNPNTLKFVVDHPLLVRGAANFPQAGSADKSPLAKALFAIPGVAAVLIGTRFVTVTKAPEGEWEIVAEEVPKAIQSHIQSGLPAVESAGEDASLSAEVSEIEQRIRNVLDEEIRPAVAMDGGDITFGKYENGILYLHLQGSCSSCPSSVATLKMGVETRLKEVVPELKEVVQV